jgi:hypothetical protein
MSSVPHPVLSNRYVPRKRALEVMGNFTRAASPDERMCLILGIQSGPKLGSLDGPQIRTFERLRNGSIRQRNGSIQLPRRQVLLNLYGEWHA